VEDLFIKVEISGGVIDPCALNGDGEECGTARLPNGSKEDIRQRLKLIDHLRQRDWRLLRERLAQLDTNDSAKVAQWLTAAGYVPSDGGWEFVSDSVTPQIRDWVERFKNCVVWLMAQDREEFREAITRTDEYLIRRINQIGTLPTAVDIERISHAKVDRDFILAIRAPASWKLSHAKLLAEILSSHRRFEGAFHWDAEGNPHLLLFSRSPRETLSLFIHLDRNFNDRQLVDCKNAASKTCVWKRFEKTDPRDEYCSARCKSYFTVNKLRTRNRLVKEASAQWKLQKRKGNRKQWIDMRVEREMKKLYPNEKNRSVTR
jgi:hypothetical protein